MYPFVIKAPMLCSKFCFLKFTTWKVSSLCLAGRGGPWGPVLCSFRNVTSPTFDGTLWIFQDLLYIRLNYFDPHRNGPQFTSLYKKLLSFQAPYGAALSVSEIERRNFKSPNSRLWGLLKAKLLCTQCLTSGSGHSTENPRSPWHLHLGPGETTHSKAEMTLGSKPLSNCSFLMPELLSRSGWNVKFRTAVSDPVPPWPEATLAASASQGDLLGTSAVSHLSSLQHSGNDAWLSANSPHWRARSCLHQLSAHPSSFYVVAQSLLLRGHGMEWTWSSNLAWILTWKKRKLIAVVTGRAFPLETSPFGLCLLGPTLHRYPAPSFHRQVEKHEPDLSLILH